MSNDNRAVGNRQAQLADEPQEQQEIAIYIPSTRVLKQCVLDLLRQTGPMCDAQLFDALATGAYFAERADRQVHIPASNVRFARIQLRQQGCVKRKGKVAYTTRGSLKEIPQNAWAYVGLRTRKKQRGIYLREHIVEVSADIARRQKTLASDMAALVKLEKELAAKQPIRRAVTIQAQANAATAERETAGSCAHQSQVST